MPMYPIHNSPIFNKTRCTTYMYGPNTKVLDKVGKNGEKMEEKNGFL